MIKTESLSFSYSEADSISFPDLQFGMGENWLITGNSGSGKTTLLHLLAGLRKPTSGKIWVMGNEISAKSQSELDHFRGQKIGIVFQTSHFVQALSTAENLQLAQFLAGIKPNNKRIAELLHRLGLEHKGHKKPAQLSVGEQQRAAIARALVNKPHVVLADEPTASLDDKNCFAMLELLKSESEANEAGLVIVTHDQRLKNQIDNAVNL